MPSEAAHFPGLRGMSQKRSDLETGPLCHYHHDEQHRIGWPRFIQTYQLDVQGILRELREKPRLFVRDHVRGWPDLMCFHAQYRDTEFVLKPVAFGLRASLDCALRVCSEYLRDSLMQRKAS
jgi:hypothetical protein